MSAVVRDMTPADIGAVLTIENKSFPSPWSRLMFEQEVYAESGRAWLVVEHDGVVLGYGGLALLDEAAHVMNLAVRADCRHRGLGRALLAHLARRARGMGARHLTLEVRERNRSAMALYEAAGLKTVGVRPGYYSETGEHAVVMWSDDITHPGEEARLEELWNRAELDLEAYPDVATGHSAPLVLGIETSCDETAAAVMRGGTELLSSVIASQVDFHARFGGVVPEIASRKHTEAIVAVVQEAMEEAGATFGDLDAIAVTHGPGLIGALVVGVAYAKGLSLATGLPLVGVNHLEGHIFANPFANDDVTPPLVALVVSGGHTSLVHVPEWGVYHTLGETLDDAAGEAFDKVAKVLGLGYPGGPVLSSLAEEGDPAAIDFPRAMLRSGDYAFSLSGLKTAVINHIRHEREAGREIHVPDLAASFQQAVIDVQVTKATRAAKELGVQWFCLAGGVAANKLLRESLHETLSAEGVRVSVPPLDLCTDNAAMIAAAGTWRFLRGERLYLDAEAVADLRLDADDASLKT
ncbi:MAG: tRNA (adenosine(37)-N6)-threonylcarbamoyltransferase complex transferase subunit TsaD [Coriobacteriia bacterium]|nr:tRNA (adenosine(37)-N6)-threonylcarbamoyltransferase complex transferase subunit TsaD [Coriobacteriia bacterium]